MFNVLNDANRMASQSKDHEQRKIDRVHVLPNENTPAGLSVQIPE